MLEAPLPPKTVKHPYAKRWDKRFGVRADGYFLVNLNGNRLDKGEVHRAFYVLSRQIGLRAVDALPFSRKDSRRRMAGGEVRLGISATYMC